MIFENEKIYKTLKKIWEFVIPAIAYFWEGLIQIWNIPYGNAILGTIILFWGALAIFLGISKYKFKKAQKGEITDEMGN